MATEFINNLSSTDLFIVEVINWNKHNQEHRKFNNNSWFKFDNDFFYDPKIKSLSYLDKLLYLALLCFCSKKNNQEVMLNKVSIGTVVGKKGYSIQQGLERLEHTTLCKVHEIIESTKHTNKQTNITNIHNYNTLQNNLLKITDLWLSVLSTFGIERNKPHLQEAQMLHSLLEANGYENLALAIIGMSYETRNDSYQPEKFLSTKLLANNFERFLNLGAKNKVDFIKNNISKLTKESFDLIQRLDTNHA